MEKEWEESEKVLRKWMKRCWEGQHAHHEAAKHYKRVNYILAIPVIVITTAIGTTSFAAFSHSFGPKAQLTVGLLSLMVAVLAALQTHLKYAERSEQHKILGASYGKIRRQIEEVLALPHEQRGSQKAVMAEIREKLDAVSAEGEAVPRWIFTRVQKSLGT